MRVLFVASELTPLAKVGGLGDVIGSLPKSLARAGVSVAALIPRYEAIDVRRRGFELVVENFPVSLGAGIEYVNLYRGVLPGSTTFVFLVENFRYLSRGPVYFSRTAFADSGAELKRFLFFSKAAHELLSADYVTGGEVFGMGGFDIIHAHDWHTGALVAMTKHQFPARRAVFTIHNLENQGMWSARELSKWLVSGRGGKFNDFGFNLSGGEMNLMAEGIARADMVTTVSPTYAKEVLTAEYGAGLELLLRRRAREGALKGILNGIDYSFWPPRKRNKLSFQKKLGLDVDARAPIFGLVSRLTYQKGIKLITPLVDKFVRRGAQFAFLGQGERKSEKALAMLARKHPKSVFAKIGFDERLAHEVYAQSDFFLMPSLFEPSGLGQMIAMRYGTIPIVRETGGLKDTVRNGATGFVFRAPTSSALESAIEEALRLFSKPEEFKKMKHACAAQDFSWTHSAREYAAMYRAVC